MVAALLCVLGVFAWSRGGNHELPPAFAARQSVADAAAMSEKDGRPVIALYTAEWCGPCATLLSGPFRDPRVETLFGRVHAAVVDCTRGHPPGDPYGVEGYPTLLEIREGRAVSRLVGAADTGSVLAWLEQVVARSGGR